MSTRPRKRGSAGKDRAPAAPRKPLEDISALHNAIQQPLGRKCQRIDVPSAEVKSLSRPRVAPKPALAPKSISQRTLIPIESESERASDYEPSSPDAPPLRPSWFHSVPLKHRRTVELMLGNAGITISKQERDALISECCDSFQAEEHVREFLEWFAVQDRVSVLTTKLCETSVWSNSATKMCYADECCDNLLAREERFGLTPDYMTTVQQDITHNMRSILVDWLVEVAEEYKLLTQTIFLAVNYVDRFLGLYSIDRNKLQLVGLTSMLIASKYEETDPPKINEFVYISDDTYTKDDVLKMECILLSSLQFNMSVPTAWEFVRGFCSSATIGDRPKFLAHFLTELFLMFSCNLKYRPSMVAAAAVFLALYTLHLPAWPNGLLQLAGNNQMLLQQCVEDMHTAHKKTLADGHALKAIREKFQESKWLRVSLVPIRAL